MGSGLSGQNFAFHGYLPVALLQVKLRSDFSNPQPSNEHVKALLVAETGKPSAESLLFTSFVMQ